MLTRWSPHRRYRRRFTRSTDPGLKKTVTQQKPPAQGSVISNFVGRPHLVPSESMEPTLHVHDRVTVDELAYRSGSPQPGDVIVFKAPPSWNVGSSMLDR